MCACVCVCVARMQRAGECEMHASEVPTVAKRCNARHQAGGGRRVKVGLDRLRACRTMRWKVRFVRPGIAGNLDSGDAHAHPLVERFQNGSYVTRSTFIVWKQYKGPASNSVHA